MRELLKRIGTYAICSLPVSGPVGVLTWDALNTHRIDGYRVRQWESGATRISKNTSIIGVTYWVDRDGDHNPDEKCVVIFGPKRPAIPVTDLEITAQERAKFRDICSKLE